MSDKNLPPELFGIDPDETWDYIPEPYRELPEEKRLVLTLKAPDAALDHLMDSDESKLRAGVKARAPEAVATIQRLARKARELKKHEQELSEDEQAEYSTALIAWVDAAASYELEHPDNFATMRRVIGACVMSWKGLRTSRGKEIAKPVKPESVIDVLPKAVRIEVYNAIRNGVRISEEEMESLQ